MNGFIIINDQVVSAGSPVFFCDNRSFRYGDCLFETLRVNNREVFFPADHLERLNKAAEFLNFKPSVVLSPDNIIKQVKILMNKNKIDCDARIRLSVFRKAGGYYKPDTDEVDYLLEATALNTSGFELNTIGLKLGVCTKVQRQRQRLSNFKTSNALVSVLASDWAIENALDECILLNDSGRVSGAAASNLFCLLKDKIYTPPLEEGCVAGTMRKKIFAIAENAGFRVHEKTLELNELKQAGEIFLTNAINGIRWASQFNEQGLNNTVSVILFNGLKKLKT